MSSLTVFRLYLYRSVALSTADLRVSHCERGQGEEKEEKGEER